MKLATMTPEQIKGAERTLAVGTWTITAGAILFSVLTVTPLVERVTPDGWDRTAPILPLVVDAAVVIVVRLDAVVSRLGGDAGRWPAVLRWMTGLMTLALNIGDSALKGNAVGVAVHSVAPLLLIVTAEAGLAYRRAITAALARIERKQADEQSVREQRQTARERQQREEREQATARREQAEREAREHAERLERERLDREWAERRETREYEARIERERAERAAAERAAEQVRADEREARERQEREQREQAARAEAERRQTALRKARAQTAATAEEQVIGRPVNGAVNTRKAPVNTPAPVVNKLPESEARAIVRDSVNTASIRELVDLTGWSIGWVAARVSEHRNEATQRNEAA